MSFSQTAWARRSACRVWHRAAVRGQRYAAAASLRCIQTSREPVLFGCRSSCVPMMKGGAEGVTDEDSLCRSWVSGPCCLGQ
jgi:hypothetical protein